MKMLISFLIPLVIQAQTAKDLITNAKVTIDLKKQYLFVQENCEACEQALLYLSECDEKIKKSYSVVAMESEVWAKKMSQSNLIKKMGPEHVYLMSYVEAKKMSVLGTPTYWPLIDKKLRPKTCDQLKNEMKM